jgi:DNA-damage-inducible protein J
MPAEAVLETRVDEDLKERASAIYAAAGLTIEDVVRRLLVRTVKEQSVPLDLFNPNAETLEAMEELRNGGGKTFATVAELMADLNADD